MDKYVFLDLDDTTFQTIRKCSSAGKLFPAASARDGSPLSFMTAEQRELFSFLDSGATIIPTTARSLSSFHRVHLEFRHCVILDFGGVILTPRKDPDPEWLERMRDRSAEAGRRLREVFSDLQDFIRKEGLTVSARIVGDLGMDFYLVVKSPDGRMEDLDFLHDRLFLSYKDDETYIHYNDNNLCLVPMYLNKANAVAYVIERYISEDSDSFITIGMGDSNSDLDFMSTCDYMIVPCSSQINRTRLSR